MKNFNESSKSAKPEYCKFRQYNEALRRDVEVDPAVYQFIGWTKEEYQRIEITDIGPAKWGMYGRKYSNRCSATEYHWEVKPGETNCVNCGMCDRRIQRTGLA